MVSTPPIFTRAVVALFDQGLGMTEGASSPDQEQAIAHSCCTQEICYCRSNPICLTPRVSRFGLIVTLTKLRCRTNQDHGCLTVSMRTENNAVSTYKPCVTKYCSCCSFDVYTAPIEMFHAQQLRSRFRVVYVLGSTDLQQDE